MWLTGYRHHPDMFPSALLEQPLPWYADISEHMKAQKNRGNDAMAKIGSVSREKHAKS